MSDDGETVHLFEGEIGVGDGWWLDLPEPYAGEEEDDGSIAFERSTRRISPQTIAYDPAEVGITPEQVLAGIVEDMLADVEGELHDLGRITGRGWVGRLFRETIDARGGEFQLLACLSAPGTVLNLSVRFLGPEGAADAREVVQRTYHDPASAAEMNAQLRRQMGLS